MGGILVQLLLLDHPERLISSIPGMGPALSRPVVEPFASAILTHTARAELDGQPAQRL